MTAAARTTAVVVSGHTMALAVGRALGEAGVPVAVLRYDSRDVAQTSKSPNLIAAAVPLLIVAACPLSMLVMMRTMAGRPSNPSPGPDRGSADRPSQLRERLAATRLEQQQLERELARLESGDRAGTAEARGNAPAADIRARPS